jgi:FkbM family methyltransferase
VRKKNPRVAPRIGRAIDRYKREASTRRMALFRRAGVDLVLDVGASVGEYAAELRRLGYRGRIVSFEPIGASFARLRARAERDPAWAAVHCALGLRSGRAQAFVSGDPRATSLLPMLPRHRQVARYFAPRRTEEVQVARLDRAILEHAGRDDRIYLKIDAQGFERQILAGGGRAMKRVIGVQLEMSLQALYRGEWLIGEAMRAMTRRGFRLCSLEYGFCDPATGEMLQVDGIFFRPAALGP